MKGWQYDVGRDGVVGYVSDPFNVLRTCVMRDALMLML